MKQIAACTYTFVFDPAETWAHLYEFEKSLAKYLEADKMAMKIIEPMGAGIAGKMIHIYPIETIAPPIAPKTPSKNRTGGHIRSLGKQLKG